MSGAKTMPFTAAGLQWKKTDYRPPPPHAELKQPRRLLDDTNLANALKKSQTDTVEFTVEEWLELRIYDVCMHICTRCAQTILRRYACIYAHGVHKLY